MAEAETVWVLPAPIWFMGLALKLALAAFVGLVAAPVGIIQSVRQIRLTRATARQLRSVPSSS